MGAEPATVFRRCSACGSGLEVPATLRATTCAFCDSALVDAAADATEPVDRVVPFSIDQRQAGERLGAFLAGRWFAPESLRRASAPDELNGVLIPFHVFDAVARTRFSARIGVYWYRTETYVVVVNGRTQARTRQVQETEWFPLEGTHVRQWFDHLVSASRGLPEAHANALEPFDLGEALPYAPSLLAGQVAERATVPKGEAATTARSELAQLEQRVIASTHLPGDTHSGLSSETLSELDAPRLVLLPVWIAVVQGPKGPIRLLVNGQTGEVVCDAIPTSWWKVGLVVALVLLVLGIVAMVVLGGALLVSLIGAVVR